jgi:hypothetical protein
MQVEANGLGEDMFPATDDANDSPSNLSLVATGNFLQLFQSTLPSDNSNNSHTSAEPVNSNNTKKSLNQKMAIAKTPNAPPRATGMTLQEPQQRSNNNNDASFGDDLDMEEEGDSFLAVMRQSNGQQQQQQASSRRQSRLSLDDESTHGEEATDDGLNHTIEGNVTAGSLATGDFLNLFQSFSLKQRQEETALANANDNNNNTFSTSEFTNLFQSVQSSAPLQKRMKSATPSDDSHQQGSLKSGNAHQSTNHNNNNNNNKPGASAMPNHNNEARIRSRRMRDSCFGISNENDYDDVMMQHQPDALSRHVNVSLPLTQTMSVNDQKQKNASSAMTTTFSTGDFANLFQSIQSANPTGPLSQNNTTYSTGEFANLFQAFQQQQQQSTNAQNRGSNEEEDLDVGEQDEASNNNNTTAFATGDFANLFQSIQQHPQAQRGSDDKNNNINTTTSFATGDFANLFQAIQQQPAKQGAMKPQNNNVNNNIENMMSSNSNNNNNTTSFATGDFANLFRSVQSQQQNSQDSNLLVEEESEDDFAVTTVDWADEGKANARKQRQQRRQQNRISNVQTQNPMSSAPLPMQQKSQQSAPNLTNTGEFLSLFQQATSQQAKKGKPTVLECFLI